MLKCSCHESVVGRQLGKFVRQVDKEFYNLPSKAYRKMTGSVLLPQKYPLGYISDQSQISTTCFQLNEWV